MRQMKLFTLLCFFVGSLDFFVKGQDFVNVATGKRYSQSSKYDRGDHSSWGANGNTTRYYIHNCIHSGNNDNNPWWQVDLGRIYPIFNITIWARMDQKPRLYPSTITVDGRPCASLSEFPGNSWSLEVFCSSVMYGSRLRITRNPPRNQVSLLNMCELQIWVPKEVSQCPVGKYGDNCNSDCSDHCGKGPGKNFCQQHSGQCYDGCADGWYGDRCSTACSVGCSNNRCDQSTGQCGPCVSPYTGPTCTDCQSGYYTSLSGRCDPCHPNCKSHSCDSHHGKCHGCVDGYYGNICNVTCPIPHCQNCDQTSGQCTQCTANSHLMLPGCSECEDGFYMSSEGVAPACIACNSHCRSPTCDRHTGQCEGCTDGYHGARCTLSCPLNCQRCGQMTGVCTQCALNSHLLPAACTDCVAGYYKPQGHQWCRPCTWTCKSGTVCDPNTGHCPVCPSGKQGDHCDQDCGRGFFGQNCTGQCGHCLQTSTTRNYCSPVTGQCSQGCDDGWKPPLCTQECDDGTWGPGCNTPCGQCKGGAVCDKVTGHCPLCELGWTTPLCNKSCTCLQFNSPIEDNAVVYACANSTLSLPWNITLSPGDSVLDIQWFFEGSSRQLIGTLANGFFFLSPTYAGRVQQSTNAGIEIDHVTTLESGNYSVEVIGRETDGGIVRLLHMVHVRVADYLQTSDGNLHLVQQSELEYNESTGRFHLVLSCGQFVYPTHPPFQVVWSTPSGAQKNSTDFKDGNFRLQLQNPPLGGVYNCTVPRARACIHGNETGEATLTLDQLEARMTLLEGEQSVLRKNNTALEKQNRELTTEVNHLTAQSQKAVSFHARMCHSLELAKGSVVVMSQVQHNQGRAYNGTTGVFTAPYHGTYYFAASTQTTTAHRDAALSLRVDSHGGLLGNGELGYVWVSSDDLTAAGSLQATVALEAGQRVWLQSALNSSFWFQPSSFTGFLVHP